MSDLRQRIANLPPEKRALLELRLLERSEPVSSEPAISHRGTTGPCPVSFAQERLWFLDQLAPGRAVYNLPQAARLSGRVELEALQKALDEIVARHEALRTTFASVDGNPVQVVAESGSVPLKLIDMSGRPETVRADEIRHLLREESDRPFDLTRDLMLRATLLRESEREHVLLLTMHHIVSDGWSIGVLFRELAVLYDAFCRGKPSPLPELPIQYADYAIWQRESLQGEVLERQLAYWRAQLAGAPAVLQLPTDRPRPAVETFRGARQSVVLSKALRDSLQKLSTREGVTLYMTLLAAFQTLLSRYTGQEDIVVGSPIAGRNRTETEDLIGFFGNTLLMRTDLSGNTSFQELLRRVREVALGAYAHQDAPFEKLVEELQPARSLSHNPLFQVIFALQNTPQFALKFPGLTARWLPVDRGTSQSDLALFMADDTETLAYSLVYNTDLFDSATITRMVGHFQTLLESIVADPEQKLSKLRLLTDAERHQLLVEWNAGLTAQWKDQCVHQLFEAQAARMPDAVAVVFEDEALTYGELNRSANQLAHYLRRRGVGPDTAVGICMERSIEMVVGLLGILKAGGAYLPLDAGYPPERLLFMLEDAGVSVLLTQEGLRQSLPRHKTEYLCIDTGWEEIARESTANALGGATTANLAYVIYTSGSTGQPKGVSVSHGSVVSLFEATESVFDFDKRDVWTLFHSYAFDFSVWEIWGCLLHGGRLVVVPLWVTQSPAEFYDLLRKEHVTVLNQTPSAIRQLVDLKQEVRRTAKDLSLRLIICGGEALRKELASQLLVWGVPLWNFYGPTEATVWAAMKRVESVGSQEGFVPIGRPISNTQIYLLDERLELVPVGVPGELHIGGDGLARGYLNGPKLSVEKFIPHPFNGGAGARLYKTGDLARYLPDGDIEFLGRMDHQVKIRGHRIELGEIEAVLAEQPGVREVVVVAREDEPDDKRLVAYLVADQRPAPPSSRLRAFLQEKLPEYMVPDVFMTLAAIPLTPNGKTDRRALPSPGRSRPELDGEFVAPRNPVEEMLVGIWTEVLGLERVGIHDNFFKLGGHSLKATQVVSRARAAFQVELPLRAFFELPTIADLATRIEGGRLAAEGLEPPPLVAVPRDRELPLSFGQQRLWFLDQLEPGSCAYNIHRTLRMRGVVNIGAVQQSVDEIVQRHEVLRTRFVAVDGRPVQVIADARPVETPVTDLSVLPESERETEARRLVTDESERPFDLTRGPLIRVRLFRLAREEHLLLVSMHHIVADRWSLGIFFHELGVLYSSFAAGEASPLPELPVQYADYAAWQRDWLRGEILEKQLAYWRTQLAGIRPALELPADRKSPAVRSFRGARHVMELPVSLSLRLNDLSRRERVTLFMTLLAGFQGLLSHYTGRKDIVVGTDIAGRSQVETESLIGFFVNLLVIRTDISGGPTFRELLRRVRDVALGAYAHQDVPFEKLVEELQPERSLGRNPLVQVLIVMQNQPIQEPTFPGLTLTPFEIDRETPRFDLVLFLAEREERLVGTWLYSTDVFDAGTIARTATDYETVLRTVVERPDVRLDQMEWRTKAEKVRHAMDKRERQESQLAKLRGTRRRSVDFSRLREIKTDCLSPGETLPLVVVPAVEDVDLVEWARREREFIHTNLLRHGAILFRGFSVSSPEQFEQFALAGCPELFGEYGDLPREEVGGKVYSSTPYPSDQAILFHNESSHMHRWPMKIWFYCMKAAEKGGETPIVDCRAIYRRLGSGLRQKFSEKGLLYVRNYTEGLDVSWQSFYRTDERSRVEGLCRQAGTEFEWKGGNGLRTRQRCPAVIRHPQTGEMAFFNQLQLHHVSCLEPAVRESLSSLMREEDLPRNVYYGDGSRIEDSVMEEISSIYREKAVAFPWQPGDVLMLNNMLVAHSRNPYVGPRKIVVAMGEMVNKDEISS